MQPRDCPDHVSCLLPLPAVNKLLRLPPRWARRPFRTVTVVACLLVSLFCVVLELVSVGPALAAGSIGVGIQAEPLALSTTVVPGHRYQFPTVYVINNGQQPFTARFAVEPLNKGAQHVLRSSWISFPTPAVLLRPGASAHVPVDLHLPAGAAGGTYLSDVVVHATPVASSGGVGAQVSAAAATKIEFTVSAPGTDSKGAIPGWVLPLLIVLAVLIVVILMWRSGIRIRFTTGPIRSSGKGAHGKGAHRKQ